jgi:hypothetical protein
MPSRKTEVMKEEEVQTDLNVMSVEKTLERNIIWQDTCQHIRSGRIDQTHISLKLEIQTNGSIILYILGNMANTFWIFKNSLRWNNLE